MINIPCSDRDAFKDVQMIISEKNKGLKKDTLTAILSRVNKRYTDYTNIELGSRIKTEIFSEIEKDSLQSLYESKTSTAKEITEPLIRDQMLFFEGKCLSCGIGDIDEIDHFLPKEHFPEFSIHHKNLIPICGSCNEIKGANIPGDNKDYIHPMFDLIPNEPFIECNIAFRNGLPTANYKISDKFKNTRVNEHFKNLKLNDRLSRKSIQYFLQIKAYKDEIGIEFAQEEINRDILKVGAIFGTRYWKLLLCQEMSISGFVNAI